MPDSEITKRIFKELIAHHGRVKKDLALSIRNNFDLYPKGCLISYGELALRTGYPGLEHIIGTFLFDIAKICGEHQWPPLNSLAVNKKSRMPGEGFAGALHCDFKDWPQTVIKCMECDSYNY